MRPSLRKNILTRRVRARYILQDRVRTRHHFYWTGFSLSVEPATPHLLPEDVIYETDMSHSSHRICSGCRFLDLPERTGQWRRPETLSRLEQLQPANHPRQLSERKRT
jgi:hypothetical protein